MVGAAVLLFALAWSAWPTREPSQAHAHAHDHTHHHVAVSRWGLVLSALPIILGVFVPAKPLSTSALANLGIETTAPTQVLNATSSVASDLASTDRTILEWTQLFQYALDPSIHDGQLADVVGFTYRDSRLSENQMYVGRFVARQPWLLYLSPFTGKAEIWRKRGEGVEQLTNTSGKVVDFTVSRDGSQIIYSVNNEQRGTDLWVMGGTGVKPRLLLECQRDKCFEPVLSPNGTQIVYQRARAGLGPGAPFSKPRLWLFQLTANRTAPLYGDPQVLGSQAQWSPNGQWVSFFDQTSVSLRVRDVATNDDMVFPTHSEGTLGVWGPDSQRLLFNDYGVTGTAFRIQLYQADLTTQVVKLVPISDTWQLRPSPPAWSPTGEWMVVSARLGGNVVGDQLWLVRPDGRDAQPITPAQGYVYGRMVWDLSGQWLLFERIRLNTPGAKTELMSWLFTNGELRLLASDAVQPAWQP